MAEAAEKRLQQQDHRGIKNLDSVKRQQQRKEEMERREEELAKMGNSGGPGLTVNDESLKMQLFLVQNSSFASNTNGL